MTILIGVETVVLVLLSILVAGLLRAHGSVLRRLHALDGGAGPTGGAREFDLLPVAVRAAESPSTSSRQDFGPAHDIAGTTLDGGTASARVTGVNNDTLVLFLSSGCSSCETFWAELGQPGAMRLPRETRLLVVPQGPADESPRDLAAMAPSNIDVIMSSQAWLDYEVPGSPHVVFVEGRTGRIRGEGTGQSLSQVAALLARSTGDAGFLTGDPAAKPARDAMQESSVDRELLAAGILPGDRRLYGAGASEDEAL